MDPLRSWRKASLESLVADLANREAVLISVTNCLQFGEISTSSRAPASRAVPSSNRSTIQAARGSSGSSLARLQQAERLR